MNILSFFDGMACGRLALLVAKIPVTNYYSFEIDPHAIKVAQNNHPTNKPMGDVTKWREWDIDWSSIDLLIGGSPCQGFSFAGKMAGTGCELNGIKYIIDTRDKYLLFKFMGAKFLSQSHLFWEYILCLDHVKKCNPNVNFMLENVKMKKVYMDLITDAIGVQPFFINSSLVSAQNRSRYYWCSWFNTPPADRHIYLKDILDPEQLIPDEMYYSQKSIDYMMRGNSKWKQAGSCRAEGYTQTIDDKKSFTITANIHKGVPYNYLEIRSGKDKNPTFNDDYMQLDPTNKGQKSQCNRVNLPDSKRKALSGTTGGNKHGVVIDREQCTYRKLTPRECGRLQTVPEKYIDKMITSGVSNTQLYKMLGNGWTIEVITHLFRSMYIQRML